MFLRHSRNDILVEVLELPKLWDPFQKEVLARIHAGEEMQDPEMMSKAELVFPSGESLPQAWVNPHYRAGVPYPKEIPAFATL